MTEVRSVGHWFSEPSLSCFGNVMILILTDGYPIKNFTGGKKNQGSVPPWALVKPFSPRSQGNMGIEQIEATNMEFSPPKIWRIFGQLKRRKFAKISPYHFNVGI